MAGTGAHVTEITSEAELREGLGGWFVDSIDGDHNNVIGISVPLVRRLLLQLGVSIPDLWRQYASPAQ